MFEEKYRIIGAKIVYYRHLRMLNQQQLADMAGISRSRLSDIEHGKTSTTLELLFLICEVLNISFIKLVDDT